MSISGDESSLCVSTYAKVLHFCHIHLQVAFYKPFFYDLKLSLEVRSRCSDKSQVICVE